MKSLTLCAAFLITGLVPALSQTQQNQPNRPPARPAQHAPAAQQQQPAPQEQQAPPRPVRTETLNFDNWSVNCAEFENPRATRCSATLRVVQQPSNQVIFAWTISVAADKKLTSALVTPTGVQILPGIDLALGKAKPRKVAYTSCTQQQCAGTLVIDEAIVREASQAESADATIQSVDGRSIKFTFPVKGVDRAVAQLRK